MMNGDVGSLIHLYKQTRSKYVPFKVKSGAENELKEIHETMSNQYNDNYRSFISSKVDKQSFH